MADCENIKSKINSNQIKSSYIMKSVLSFLNEKQKLKMIVNNKELQKMFLIDVENYKIISGKYKIGGKTGKGFECIIDTNIIIFEGEYLNGKRNGKGKEYYKNNQLLFEGQYLNGEKNGKGKEYNSFGELIFEGEYLNGKRVN